MQISTVGPAWLTPPPALLKPRDDGQGFDQALAAAERIAPLSGEEQETGTQRLFDPGPDYRFTTEELDRIRDEALASVEALVTTRLSEAGVAMSPGFALGLDAEDRVYVQDGHPDEAAIAQVFEQDAIVRLELAKALSIIRSREQAEEIKEFQKAYAANPELAMTQPPDFFDGPPKEVFLPVGEQA